MKKTLVLKLALGSLIAMVAQMLVAATYLDYGLIQTSGAPSLSDRSRFYGYQSSSVGPGDFAFGALKELAESNNIPLVVIYCSERCATCDEFARQCNYNTRLMTPMLAASGALFGYFRGDARACREAAEFCNVGEVGSCHVCAFYWLRSDGEICREYSLLDGRRFPMTKIGDAAKEFREKYEIRDVESQVLSKVIPYYPNGWTLVLDDAAKAFKCVGGKRLYPVEIFDASVGYSEDEMSYAIDFAEFDGTHYAYVPADGLNDYTHACCGFGGSLKATCMVESEWLYDSVELRVYSGKKVLYEPTNRVTKIEGREIKYRASIWGDTALVTDCPPIPFSFGGHTEKVCMIPKTVDGMNVVALSSSTFSKKDEITALVVPFHVTAANAGAFMEFSQLQSIAVEDAPDGVAQELICEDGAFYSEDKAMLYFVTAKATSLTIPAAVCEIVVNAFQNAVNLQSVAIDPGNQVFKIVNDMICTADGTKIVSALPYMKELRFPEKAVEVNWPSFSYCHSLATFCYDNSPLCDQPLMNAGFPAEQLQKITKVVIDESVTEIADYAFEGFSGLCDVQITSTVTRIGAYAFSGCSIGMLTVPQSVEELGVYFYNGGILRLECPLCYFTDESGNVPYDPFDPMWLSNVLDPYNTYIICSEDVAEEWDDAIYFGGFNLPGQNYVWNVGDWNVNGRIEGGCVVVDDLSYNGVMAWDGTETLSIPDSVGPFTIAEVRNLGVGGALANLVFPASLKSVGGCLSSVIWSGTKTVTFEAGVPDGFTEWMSELFDNEVTVCYPDAFADEWCMFVGGDGKVKFAEQPYADVGDLRYRLSWKDGAWSIIEVCFVPDLQEEPPHPTTLTLPTTLLGHSVKGIDGELIGGCVLGCIADSLREVVIPAGYERIGKFALQSLYNLRNVNIPEGVTFIGAGAFADCHGIECLTIPASVVKMGCNVFDGAILHFECNCPKFVQDDGMPVDNQYLGWLSSVLGTGTYIDCTDEVFESWRDAIFYGGFNQYGQVYFVYGDERHVDFQVFDREAYITQLSYNMMIWDGAETLVLPGRIGPFPVCGISGVGIGGPIAGVEFPSTLCEISCGDLDNIAGSISTGAMTFKGGVPFGFAEATGLRGKLVNYPEEFAAEWSVFVDDKGRAKFSGQPYEIVAGVKYTFTCGDGGATIVFAEPLYSIPAVLRIPDKLLGLPVKGVGESAFTQGYGFEGACTSVVIPSGVEVIGRYAFSGFCRMTTLVLPASVSVVKGGAFYGCSALRTLTLANPEIITFDRETGEAAFDSSTMPSMVTAVRIPDGISTESLRTVKVPEGATKIPAGAFAGCANLYDLTLPESLTSISKCAFACCKSLPRVKIPRGVTEIGDGAFAFCSSLSEIALPAKLDKIGNGLFLFCSNLRDVEITARVKEIGDYAFIGCAADRFVIPASVEKVGANVFAEYGRAKYGYYGLVSFCEIPLLVFKGKMPDGFYSMLPDGVSVDELVNTVLPQELSELALTPEDDPNGFVAGFLEQERYESCNRLGESGVDMGRLFSLAETFIAHTDTEDASWDDIWAFGYNPYGCSRPLSFEDGNGYFDFVVTEGGAEIVGGEFYDEFTLGDDGVMSSVSTIPSAILALPVMRIGESAFEGSWRDFPEWGVRPRMSIVLPYTLKEVGDFAFADCNWLSDIVIPEGVSEIGWAAFAGCTELRKVVLPSTLGFVGDEAFSGCTKLRDVGFSSTGMTALGVGAFAACSSLEDVSLFGVDVIGDAAFEGCESLRRVMLDAVLVSIGVDALNACFKLQQLVFNGDVPEGLQLAGYPAGTRIDYPAQYAENWKRALGADSVSCAMRAPGLMSVTTRIAANVAENAPVAKSVTLLGSEETINRALDLNISPRVIDEGVGSFSLEYKDPQLTIVDFNPTDGLILVRVEPEEGCEIVGKVPLERVRLIGYDDLSNMTHGKVVPIQIDDSEYLTQGSQGLLTLRFDASLANFFTASIVDVAVQGE